MSTADSEYVDGTKGLIFPNGWPKSIEIKKYCGGCHCGKFRYEAEYPSVEKAPVIQCNCTSCSQKGSVVFHSPLSRFQLTRGTLDELSKYQYNTKVVSHYFCPACGSQLFSIVPPFGVASVNINTVDDIDTSKLIIRKHDGRSA